MRLLGIKKTRTTALHPQSDGQVERYHQTILNYLAKFISEDQKDWDNLVPMYLLAYRSSKHAAMGASPAELYFARDLRLSLDLLRGSSPERGEENSSEGCVQRLKKKLNDVYNDARRRLNLQSLRSKIRYDQRAKKINFNISQNVWFYNPRRKRGKSPKLQSNWEGPYKIIKKLSDAVYEIRKSNKHKCKVVHSDRLALFHERQRLD